LSEDNNVTPMVAQYLEVKKAHKDCLLLYRLGDFYELFYEDAQTAAKILDLVLTKRQDMPMCGIPYHALDSYIGRLIRAGYKVAIAEQMETPEAAKARGAKSVVKREVIRIITPGTINDENLLESAQSNFLFSLNVSLGKIFAAWVDISTGDFFAQEVLGDIAALVCTINPKEILLSDELDSQISSQLKPFANLVSFVAASHYTHNLGLQRIQKIWPHSPSLEVGMVGVISSLLGYIELTQVGKLPILKPIKVIAQNDLLFIDASTRKSLELVSDSKENKKFSLQNALDMTASALGSRLLANYVSTPLACALKINERLEAVDLFVQNAQGLSQLREVLKSFPDLERALSRISMRRANPRDLAAIRDGLALVPKLKLLMLQTLAKNNLEEISYFKNLDIELASENEIFEELKRALLPDLPLTAREGGVIAAGYNAQLDEFKNLSSGGAKMMADLQAKYMQKTGVNLLRIKYNNIIGYFIEVPPKSAQALLEDTFFIHRQTMVSGIRFTTSELKELEGQVISAQSRALNLELEIFNNLCEKINGKASEIYQLAQMVAKIDVASALALVAQTYNYVRPIVDDSVAFEIRAGRHPVVEQALKKEGAKAFITNDCKLNENDEINSKLWLITGPNMAGKSTFLRGNALIAIMAHIGSFVPADYAHIGVIDKLFSRVGSGDDLAQGRSTFMVEMQELAGILNNAGERSFIILDEIGRGTSTYDGMSIAWSAIEYLHDVNKSRVLVSTHYHELTELANKLNQLSLHTMQVQEYGSDVVFLHKIGAGVADRSYGIHVARLAGLPSAVNARAQEILDLLETSAKSGKMAKLAENLPLFDFSKPEVRKPDYTELVALLKSIQPDDLSPKEALSALYELKKSLK